MLIVGVIRASDSLILSGMLESIEKYVVFPLRLFLATIPSFWSTVLLKTTSRLLFDITHLGLFIDQLLSLNDSLTPGVELLYGSLSCDPYFSEASCNG